MCQPASTKTLLAFLLIIFASAAIPVQAQRIPATPPTQWAINIRFYGTTSQPGRDDLQITIHTNGQFPVSISARRPIYDERGIISPKSPEYEEKLSDEAHAAIYDAARSVILSHRIGEEPDAKIADGGSVDVAIRSYNRSLSAGFDHSSAVKSAEFKALVKVLRSELPKEFLPGIVAAPDAGGKEADGLDPPPLKSLSAAERAEASQARDRADLMRSDLEGRMPHPGTPAGGDGRGARDLGGLDAEAVEVARAYQEVIERYPHTDIAAYCATRLAGFFQQRGRFDDAAKVLEETADEFAGTAEGHKAIFGVGLIHAQARHDPLEASRWFAKIPEPANPSDAEALTLYLSAQKQLIKCELALDLDSQAEERLKELKAAFPQFADELANFFQFEVESRKSQAASKPVPGTNRSDDPADTEG